MNIQYAVQGRYAFPVLLPWLALLSRYGLALVPDRLAWPVVGALSALFVLGDGPWLWWRAPAAWWSGP